MSKPVPKPDIDEVIELIISGMSFRKICDKFNMKLSTFADWRARPEHTVRINEALQLSADNLADKALDALLNISRESNMVQMNQARELAFQYRWLAARKNPKIYSEKQQIDMTQTVRTIKFKKPEAPSTDDDVNDEQV